MRAMEYTPVQCRCEPMGQWTLVQWCLIHRTQIEPTKKLTDAECAAEYWRAMYDVMTMIAQDFGYQATPQPRTMREVIRWGEVANRFASYPHASEVEQ